MKIFQVIKPDAIFLDEQSKPPGRNQILLLYQVEASYIEANLALNFFERAAIAFTEYMRAYAYQQAGAIPRAFMQREPFVHAHSFIYALDSFQSVLLAWSKEDDVSPSLATALAAFETNFPTLRDIRNSAHHMEDRVRRLKTGNKPIAVQPNQAGPVFTSNQAMVLSSFNGDNYGTTLANGQYAEISISSDSMSKLQTIFQDMLNGLKWHTSHWGNNPSPVIQ